MPPLSSISTREVLKNREQLSQARPQNGVADPQKAHGALVPDRGSQTQTEDCGDSSEDGCCASGKTSPCPGTHNANKFPKVFDSYQPVSSNLIHKKRGRPLYAVSFGKTHIFLNLWPGLAACDARFQCLHI